MRQPRHHVPENFGKNRFNAIFSDHANRKELCETQNVRSIHRFDVKVLNVRMRCEYERARTFSALYYIVSMCYQCLSTAGTVISFYCNHVEQSLLFRTRAHRPSIELASLKIEGRSISSLLKVKDNSMRSHREHERRFPATPMEKRSWSHQSDEPPGNTED